jgi:hypothetical protein
MMCDLSLSNNQKRLIGCTLATVSVVCLMFVLDIGLNEAIKRIYFALVYLMHSLPVFTKVVWFNFALSFTPLRYWKRVNRTSKFGPPTPSKIWLILKQDLLSFY